MSVERQAMLFDAVDNDGNGNLDRGAFQQLCTMLRMGSQGAPPRHTWLQIIAPDFVSSSIWQAVDAFVRSRAFELVIDAVLVCNAVLLLVLEFVPDPKHELDAWNSWSTIMGLVFTWIFVIEMLLKLASLGFIVYARSLMNLFDAVVTVAGVVLTALIIWPNGYDDPIYLRYVLLLRFVRFFRVFYLIPAVAFIISTFVRMIPNATVLIAVLLSGMYVIAALGMQFFGGLINRDPNREQGALLTADKDWPNYYWPNNFNDMMSGMVVCFELLVVNNWHVVTEGFACVAGHWARWFFIINYLFMHNLILNLLIAFAIEAYNAAMKESRTARLAEIEQGYYGDDGPSVHHGVHGKPQQIHTPELLSQADGVLVAAQLEYQADVDKLELQRLRVHDQAGAA